MLLAIPNAPGGIRATCLDARGVSILLWCEDELTDVVSTTNLIGEAKTHASALGSGEVAVAGKAAELGLALCR